MNAPTGPNPLRAAWSIARARRSSRPNPGGDASIDHAVFGPILEEVARTGVGGLSALRSDLHAYRDGLAEIDPDDLSRDEALAYWLNLYNAGALDAAAETAVRAESSVLRLPGAFERPWANVAGEHLSLDAIEHGKIRRFLDPRIHGALVCGSASCPTLRGEPYRGDSLDVQLDDQMAAFLAGGGAVADRTAGVLRLSRIFRWYGGDFTRPHRMPTWLPARKQALLTSLRHWLPDATLWWLDESQPKVMFQPYDWSLACSIG